MCFFIVRRYRPLFIRLSHGTESFPPEKLRAPNRMRIVQKTNYA